MQAESNKKRRTPLTPEEVATVIAFKKRKEQLRLVRLKRSFSYKIQNCFNILCFFVFSELLLCYFGPSRITFHEAVQVIPVYGDDSRADGTPILSELDVRSATGKLFKFVVNDFMDVPEVPSEFRVGEDFLLKKDLKGSFEADGPYFRVFAASPVLFLSIFTSVVTLLAICYNLNENEHSLLGLTTINFMTLLCVLFIS